MPSHDLHPLKNIMLWEQNDRFDEKHTIAPMHAKDSGNSVIRLTDAGIYMIIFGYNLMKFQAWCLSLGPSALLFILTHLW